MITVLTNLQCSMLIILRIIAIISISMFLIIVSACFLSGFIKIRKESKDEGDKDVDKSNE